MRNRKPPFQHRFDLYQEVETHVELHDYLKAMADDGGASTWIRGALIAVMKAEKIAIDVPKTLAVMHGPITDIRDYRNAFDLDENGEVADEPHYVDPEEIP